jgi:flagellin FlaB
MKRILGRFIKDESGVTALETAIILIAFVVVAAVFAFTMLTTGTFLTERSKEAALAGVSQVRGSMEIRGGMIITGTTAIDVENKTNCDLIGASVTNTINTANHVQFTLANVAGGQPVDLHDAIGQQVTTISYRDQFQNVNLTNTSGSTQLWTVSWIGKNNGDNILEQGELAQIDVDLTGIACPLGPNRTFDIEVKPPSGAVLSMERTTPARIDNITDLK